MKRIIIYVLTFTILLISFSSFAFADSSDNRVSGQDVQEGESVDVQVLRVSPSDTSGLHAIILQLLGDYNPVIEDYTYTTTSYNGSVQTNHSIEITPDYSWIATACIFLIVIYCIFRLIGSIFSGRL